MAINVLRGLRDRAARAAATPSETVEPVGSYEDYDQPSTPQVRGPRVGCPNCGRFIGLLQTECPGCGLHVLAGVPIKRGGLLVVAGCAGGLVIGLFLAVGLALIQRPAQAAGTAPLASAAAVASVDPSADPGLVSGPVPPTSAVALRLSATVLDRLAGSATALRSQLKSKSFSAATAAGTIRAIAADAAWGSEVVDQLSGWPAATRIKFQLIANYATLRASARDALSVSLQDNAKYKSAARQMVKLLGSAAAIRVSIDALAGANGITVPAAVPGQ